MKCKSTRYNSSFAWLEWMTRIPPTGTSWLLGQWDCWLIIASMYSIVATPLLLAFPKTRYVWHQAVEAVLDGLFCLDVLIRLRTIRIGIDGNMMSPSASARIYLNSYFSFDLIAALPLQQVVTALVDTSEGQNGSVKEGLRWLHLLRALRGRFILHSVQKLTGANVLRVIQMIMGFLVVAHYLGCFWCHRPDDKTRVLALHVLWLTEHAEAALENAVRRYRIAIYPLMEDTTNPARIARHSELNRPWLWIDEGPYDTATLYVCSVYWALSVMTNLKGINAHESRRCLYRDPLVPAPLRELFVPAPTAARGDVVHIDGEHEL